MQIFLGADHRGFVQKEQLKVWLTEKGHQVTDCGNTVRDPADDFTVFAAEVGRNVAKNSNSRGIVLCGSGIGVDVTANKIKGIRSSLGLNPEQVKAGRSDDDVNVLAIASGFTSIEDAQKMIAAFLETPFKAEERMVRRIQHIQTLENEQ